MKKLVEIVVVAMALMALLCSCGNSNDDATSVISDEYKKLTSASELAEDAKQAIQKEYDTFSLNCTVPDESEFSDTYYRIDYDWNVWTEDECKKKMQDALSLENEDYQEKCLDWYECDDLSGSYYRKICCCRCWSGCYKGRTGLCCGWRSACQGNQIPKR